jgi:uncharacterized protein (DUF2235 family)
MQNTGRPDDPNPPSGITNSQDNNRSFTPPRTLVLCFDGVGNQFDAVVHHDTDSGPQVSALVSLAYRHS